MSEPRAIGRCLACGMWVYGDEYLPEMCPQRYITPHTEAFMDLVAQELAAADALKAPSRVQHEEAIQRALSRYSTEEQ
jgi:hypothetical protein